MMPFSGQASFCFDCEYSAQEVWGCRIVRFPSEYFREHVDSNGNFGKNEKVNAASDLHGLCHMTEL